MASAPQPLRRTGADHGQRSMVNLVLDKVIHGAAPVANTSDHDRLEGRGDEILPINMIDDATSRWFRFVLSDSTAENMNLLERYMKKHGRPLASTLIGRRCLRPHRKPNRVNPWRLATDRNCRPRNSAGRCRSWESCGYRHTVRRPKGVWNGDLRRLRTGW